MIFPTPPQVFHSRKATQRIPSLYNRNYQDIGEVRNEYGSRHGKDGKIKDLQPRHAKLAVGAAFTLAIYLLETHELKIDYN